MASTPIMIPRTAPPRPNRANCVGVKHLLLEQEEEDTDWGEGVGTWYFIRVLQRIL